MNAHETIKFAIGASAHVVDSLLADLSDADMLHRPTPGCNHINWQVGHCVAAEHNVVAKAIPGAMPPLPAGFAEKYTGATAKLDDAKSFCSKAELLRVFGEQRAATLAALEKADAADLDKPCEGWTPNLALCLPAWPACTG